MSQLFVVACDTLCGPSVTIGETGQPCLMSEQAAREDVAELADDGFDYYMERVEQDGNGDWIGVESDTNWSKVAREL